MLSLLPKVLRALLVIALYNVLVAASPAKYDEQIPIQNQATDGAVVSESDECSRAGTMILMIGGNAVDAVVATTLCVGVVAPYHSGIGGGGFMLVRDKSGGYEAIDFREAAPAEASKDMYKGKIKQSIYGGLSVAVPSELRGLKYAHEKYGQLPWATVFAPAIRFAEKGFRVNLDMERYIRSSINGHSTNFLAEDPSWAKDFVQKGKLVGVGQNITRKRYAKTLTEIAQKGVEEFYTGKIAEQMISTIRKAGGVMNMKDLKNYKVISRPVLNVTYRGYNLYGVGAPASGAVTLNILKVMETFEGGFKHRKQTIHNYVEAMKFAYGARLRLCDPEYDADMVSYQRQMLDPGTIDKIRQKIDPDHTQPIEAYDPKGIYPPENHGTSQITTADRDGMAVSLTTTVNLLWGSQLMDSKTGVILNNEMNDFSIPGVPNEFGLKPSKENFIRPGKRPQSSITPIIVTDKDNNFFAAIGAAGGSRIISATTQALFHILNDGVDIQWAVNEPRLHDQVIPPTLLVEKRFNISAIEYLRDRGHNITWVSEGLSAVHGVQLKPEWNGQFKTGNDQRQKSSGGKTVP